MDQPKVDPRANLFHLLQTLSRVAEFRNPKASANSEISDEKIAFGRNNEIWALTEASLHRGSQRGQRAGAAVHLHSDRPDLGALG